MTTLKFYLLVALVFVVAESKPFSKTSDREQCAMDIIFEINKKMNSLRNLVQGDVKTEESVDKTAGLSQETTSGTQETIGSSRRKRRGAVTGTRFGLWENGIINYIIDGDFTDQQIKNIQDAIKDIEEKTCIRFKRERGQSNYIKVVKQNGCWSFIGRIRGPEQLLSLGGRCANDLGVIKHEFIHAIGFFHEHARPDRDNYVEFHPENVAEGFVDQFDKRSNDEIDSLNIPYDINSIMHYSRFTFSVDARGGRATLTKIDDEDALLGGSVITESDAEQINLLYQCSPSVSTTTTPRTTTTPKTTTTSTTTTKTTTDTLPCQGNVNILSEFVCQFYGSFGFCGFYPFYMTFHCSRRCCEINSNKKR